jgi:UDP-glucose:(heptosyl)LPS alpha-1,3-glucosyltransferase
MDFAFGIVSMFPGGGLQRDCAALARTLRARGHKVTLFASRVSGPLASDLAVELLPNSAWTNHGRNLRFAADLARACAGRFDRVVGFNKLSGLDVLYCADPAYAARRPGGWRQLMPRDRALRSLEAACFAPGRPTRLILLSRPQIEAYRQAWGTEPERIELLPPTTDIGRRQPQFRTDGTRERMRAALGIAPDDWVWFAIGVQPRVKGLDRTIEALDSHPDARLLVAGLSETPGTLYPIARGPRVIDSNRIRLLGFREDIPELMAAADLLVHPARLDITGGVILEAIANGLPVIATAACGYAEHIDNAAAGIVVPEPFDQGRFTVALATARDPDRRALWSANAISYGQNAELYSGLEKAAAMIMGDA